MAIHKVAGLLEPSCEPSRFKLDLGVVRWGGEETAHTVRLSSTLPGCPRAGPYTVLAGWGVSCALRSSTLPLLPEGKEQTPPGGKVVGSSPHPPRLTASLPRQVPPIQVPLWGHPLPRSAGLPDPPSLFMATGRSSTVPQHPHCPRQAGQLALCPLGPR